MDATAAITEVRQLLAGRPIFLAGSAVAAEQHGLPDAYTDIDLFVPTSQVLIATGQHLLDQGFTFAPRFERTWERWMRYGFKTWHTNSLKLHSPGGLEYNLVYKLTEGHAATSLAEVLESFDFGLLAVGYDLEANVFRDMRGYLFPQEMAARSKALPMMPNKRMNWRQGFISQYNGLRESGRYAKYHRYGYDLSLVKQDLIEGYAMAALYMCSHFDTEKQALGRIYQAIGDHIELDHIDELLEAERKIEYKDALDVIMEALE